jgi:hypothetical protein
LEDWKIKISVLWLVAAFAFLAHQILLLLEPGTIAKVMAGEAEGMKIGPGLILFFAILMLVPLVVAFLSLILKDSIGYTAFSIFLFSQHIIQHLLVDDVCFHVGCM